MSAQLVRFIELIFEREATSAFRERPAAVLTTSIKFFDCTAHDYLPAICEDLGENSELGALRSVSGGGLGNVVTVDDWRW